MLKASHVAISLAALAFSAAPLSPSHAQTVVTPAAAAPLPVTIRARGPASDHTPVIFVHGIFSDFFPVWSAAIPAFQKAGYTPGDITDFHYVSLDGTARGAAQLAAEVDWLLEKTGKTKVDIVSHSFGSLVTKLCIVEGGCSGKVARWESLAGASNGTNLAGLPVTPTTTDLSPTSPLITRLQELDDAAFAAQGIKVQVQWSPTDEAILPPTLSKEPFADNVQLPDSVTHQSIIFDAAVIARTISFLAR